PHAPPPSSGAGIWLHQPPNQLDSDRKTCHRRASAGSEALLVKIPTRYTFPGCCASAASGAGMRLTARTTPSPIRRIGTSVRMAGGSLADESGPGELAAL